MGADAPINFWDAISRTLSRGSEMIPKAVAADKEEKRLAEKTRMEQLKFALDLQQEEDLRAYRAAQLKGDADTLALRRDQYDLDVTKTGIDAQKAALEAGKYHTMKVGGQDVTLPIPTSSDDLWTQSVMGQFGIPTPEALTELIRQKRAATENWLTPHEEVAKLVADLNEQATEYQSKVAYHNLNYGKQPVLDSNGQPVRDANGNLQILRVPAPYAKPDTNAALSGVLSRIAGRYGAAGVGAVAPDLSARMPTNMQALGFDTGTAGYGATDQPINPEAIADEMLATKMGEATPSGYMGYRPDDYDELIKSEAGKKKLAELRRLLIQKLMGEADQTRKHYLKK